MRAQFVIPVIVGILILGTVSLAFASSSLTTIPISLPNGIDVNPNTNLLYATSQGDAAVYIIDGASNTIIGLPIPVGVNPHQVAVNTVTNYVYVTNQVSDTVSVIDIIPGSPTENTVVATIPRINGGLGIAVNEITNLVYVATGAGGTFYVIDGATNTIIHSIPLGNDLSGVAVNPNTNKVYVTQSTSAGNVHVINAAAPFNVLGIVTVGIFPNPIEVHLPSNTVYTAAGGTNPAVYAIDSTTDTVVGSSIPLPGSPFARAMAINPDTNRIFIATEGILHVVDGTTKAVVDTHPIGASTSGMTVNPITNLVYTADHGANVITVVQDTPPSITVQDTIAPDVTVPSDITIHATSPAGAEVTFSSSATDIVDGAVSTTCTPASGDTFAIDTTEVTCTATDNAGNIGSASFNITVFNTAPVCSDVTPSTDSLWPPNHKYKSISINGVTDGDGDAITITIDSIFQDEAVDAKGSGNTSPDGEIDGDTANVRSERTGKGDGRIYEISFTADDGLGGICSGSVTVGVPHDKKSTAVDSGDRFDSTLP